MYTMLPTAISLRTMKSWRGKKPRCAAMALLLSLGWALLAPAVDGTICSEIPEQSWPVVKP